MENWRELKAMVKALAGVTRLAIIYHLSRDEKISVSDLSITLGISQPLVSWHLRKLRRAGLIETRREGRQVYCIFNQQRFRSCLQRLEGLIDPSVQSMPPVGAALIEAEAEREDS
uniref:HTH arsR-type domain-containing protein n=1 Tax=Thermosporothrix sp. COM3 TaxID=2490863 RepID=A0A455SND0_9CHLR|nr:hypothetical protein KTC_46480 [Thermosporothrix sp. COM3]